MAGDDAAGIYYTQQTYDWKGRPLVTTNPDLTTKTASYSGCGCAGGEVVTLTDEGTIDGGVAKRRQQKIYSDVLGRTVKTEVFNWQGGSVYSTTVNTYNVRDQLTQVRQYAGAEGSSTYQQTTTAYDGYGRLKTKKVPEQSVGSATVWEYNNDNTLHKITDARGASATYIYNNDRHLVSQIQYYAPTGVAGTATVTFTYDAAGNRTSMNDGVGSHAYAYNSLSRLSSETRTISDPAPPYLNASFTLTYDYNLAGSLKKITDPWNVTINYGIDTAGRLASVTGLNYGVSQFINSIGYRAWGAPKQVAYGNGRTASMNYNSRLQTSHFEIPNAGGLQGVMSIDYQYHADGRLRYSHNILDPRFDRSYQYDHATRIVTALSGAEARGEPATTDRPYNESFTYDAFDHLTNRDTRSWSNSRGFWSNDSYTNNRRNAWTYDPQGNLTNNLKRQYSYDAAGQMVAVSSSGGGLNQVFDGFGNRIKTTELGIATYYVRSTVLSQVVSELDSTGVKQRSFVYADGRLLAESGLLVHEDVSGTSIRKTNAQTGHTILSDELDPMGADAYIEDPYIDNPEFSGRGEGGPVHPGYGNITDPSRGCTNNGIYNLCEPDIAFWGSDIVKLAGFGTSWGSFAALGEWEHNARLANTRALLQLKKHREREELPARVPVDFLTKAIADCISEMWPDYSLVSFTATKKPAGGRSRDEFNGETQIKDVHTNKTAIIVSDPTPDAITQAAMDTNGLGGATPSANPWNPYWGFVRWGRDIYGSAASEYVYPILYGTNKYLQTQIHELGVSLSQITKKFYLKNWKPLGAHYFDPHDFDNGSQFEDCVGKKSYDQLGLTPQKMNVGP